MNKTKKLAKWAWYGLGYLIHIAQINGEIDIYVREVLSWWTVSWSRMVTSYDTGL